jgi:hypothetical protein
VKLLSEGGCFAESEQNCRCLLLTMVLVKVICSASMAQLWCAHHVAEAAVEAASELNQNMLLVKFDLKFIHPSQQS